MTEKDRVWAAIVLCLVLGTLLILLNHPLAGSFLWFLMFRIQPDDKED